MADGISSTNSFEIPIALDQLRQMGASVATSESLGFQLIGDAAHPNFRAWANIVKQEKEKSVAAGRALLLSMGSNNSVLKGNL